MAGATRTITVRLPCEGPESLFQRIEIARGRVPREVWVRDAFERVLREAAAPAAVDKYERQPGPNVLNIRSTEQVRRDIGPIPKGGTK